MSSGAKNPPTPEPEDSGIWDELMAGAFGDHEEGPPSIIERLAHRGHTMPSVHVPDAKLEAAPPSTLTTTADLPRAGDRMGRYVILGEIARGGVGVVYRARDLDIGREVALKILREERADHAEILERFVEEAQISGQLQHPGIVPIYEMGLDRAHRPYFAMELIRGRTFQRMLADRSSASADRPRLLEIFDQICQTLAYAHARQVIHRDLKPANVMLGPFGEVRVVDWGFAKVLASGGVADEIAAARPNFEDSDSVATVRSGPDAHNSVQGAVLGTPSYMAPEQARGQAAEIDERADVFALGAILCEILTGEPPYRRQAGSSIIEQASEASLEDAYARLDAEAEDRELAALARQCLHSDPAKRLRSAEELAAAIATWKSDRDAREESARERAATASERARSERKARRLTMALAIVVIATLGIGGGSLYYRQFEEVQRTRAQDARVEALFDEIREALLRHDVEAATLRLERAGALVETGPVSPHIVSTRAGLVIRLQKARELQAAARSNAADAAAANARDQRLKDRLEDILDAGPSEDIADTLTQAFADYGIDFEKDSPSAVAQRVRDRGDDQLREQVVRALDTWASSVGYRRGRPRPSSQQPIRLLTIIASNLDEDPWRRELRAATVVKDRERLLELSQTVDPARMGRGSMRFLIDSLQAADASDRARELLQSAVLVHVDDGVLHERLGLVLIHEEGREQDALRHAAIAVALDPTDPSCHLLHYRAIKQLEGAEAALRHLEFASLKLPESDRLRITLARHHIEAEDPEAAIAVLEPILGRASNNPWALRELVKAHKLSGNKEAEHEARGRLQEAQHAGRRRPPSHGSEGPAVDLGWARLPTARVLDQLRRDRDARRDDLEAHLRLASMNLALADYDAALSAARDGLRIRSDDRAATLEALALTALGRYESAKQAWDRAVEFGSRSMRVDFALRELERLKRCQNRIRAGERTVPEDSGMRDFIAHFRVLSNEGLYATALRGMSEAMHARWSSRRKTEPDGKTGAGGRRERSPGRGQRSGRRRSDFSMGGRMSSFSFRLDLMVLRAQAGLAMGPANDEATPEERSRWRADAQKSLKDLIKLARRNQHRIDHLDLNRALQELHWPADLRVQEIRAASLALPEAEAAQWRSLWNAADALLANPTP